MIIRPTLAKMWLVLLSLLVPPGCSLFAFFPAFFILSSFVFSTFFLEVEFLFVYTRNWQTSAHRFNLPVPISVNKVSLAHSHVPCLHIVWPVSIKFYCLKATPTHLHIVFGGLQATTAEQSSCGRDTIIWPAKPKIFTTWPFTGKVCWAFIPPSTQRKFQNIPVSFCTHSSHLLLSSPFLNLEKPDSHLDSRRLISPTQIFLHVYPCHNV